MFYRIVSILLGVVFKLLFRLRIYNCELVPKFGPVIISANHISLMDPFVLCVALRRFAFFMAKKELFENPVFSVMIRKLNAFPIEREGIDIKSLRRAIGILRQKNALVIFPQGRREKDEPIKAIKKGVCSLARLTGSPIVPAFIFNSKDVLKFKQIKVAFGEPIYVRDESDVSHVIDAMNNLRNDYKGC